MRWDFLREIVRKGVHLTIILVIVAYIIILNVYGKMIALMSLVGLLIFILIIEYLRLDWDIRNPVLDFLIRPKEIGKIHGAVYFLSATIICFAVFDFNIALAALLMATFGDMFAAVLGQKYGHTMIYKKKTLIGAVSELIVNLIVGFLVLFTYTNIYIIIIMAFTATIIEILSESIDDNLAVPLLTGFLGQLLMMV
jgi:dolichol kinase